MNSQLAKYCRLWTLFTVRQPLPRLAVRTLCAAAQSNYATAHTFSTLAGYARVGGVDAIGSTTLFANPRRVAADINENV